MTPDQCALIRLLSLDSLGPVRCRWLTGSTGPAATIEWMLGGSMPSLGPSPRGVRSDVVDRWRSLLRESVSSHTDADLEAAYSAADVDVLDDTAADWPFADDPDPPSLLFYRGDRALLNRRPAVAIVGSRRCTTVGRTVAERMGAELAAMGVAVVSGLALGIDGEAHGGVFKAWTFAGEPVGSPIGVVASGLDIIYPKKHSNLWDRVASDGLLVSETPLGVSPTRWRFPARNRIIAALADGVVVVESHESGGALSTAAEAIDRAVPVFAVPGSVLNVAADGTNRLLMDGAAPVRSATDVIEALGLTMAPAELGDQQIALQIGDESGDESKNGSSVGLSGIEAKVCAELSAGSLHVDQLARACDVSAIEMVAIVQRLSLNGRAVIGASRVRLR